MSAPQQQINNTVATYQRYTNKSQPTEQRQGLAVACLFEPVVGSVASWPWLVRFADLWSDYCSRASVVCCENLNHHHPFELLRNCGACGCLGVVQRPMSIYDLHQPRRQAAMSIGFGDLHVHFAMSGSLAFWREYLDELRANADDNMFAEATAAHEIAVSACKEAKNSATSVEKLALQTRLKETKDNLTDIQRRCGYGTTFAEIERRLTALQAAQQNDGAARWVAFSSCMRFLSEQLLKLPDANARLLRYNAQQYKAQGVVYVEFSLAVERLIEDGDALAQVCSDIEREFGVRMYWLAAFNRGAVKEHVPTIWREVNRMLNYKSLMADESAPTRQIDLCDLDIASLLGVFENGNHEGFREARQTYEKQLQQLQDKVEESHMFARYVVGLDLHGLECQSPIVPFVWPSFQSFAFYMQQKCGHRFGFRIHTGELPPEDFGIGWEPPSATVAQHSSSSTTVPPTPEPKDDETRRAQSQRNKFRWFVTQAFAWQTCNKLLNDPVPHRAQMHIRLGHGLFLEEFVNEWCSLYAHRARAVVPAEWMPTWRVTEAEAFRRQLWSIFLRVPVELCAISNYLLLSRCVTPHGRRLSHHCIVRQATRTEWPLNWLVVLGTDDPVLFHVPIPPSLPGVRAVSPDIGSFTALRGALASPGYANVDSAVVDQWAANWRQCCFASLDDSRGGVGYYQRCAML